MPIKVTYNPDMLATGDLAHAAGRGQFLQEQDRFNEQIRQYDQSLAFKAQLARLENQRAHQAAQEQARQFNLSLDQRDRLAAAEAAMEQQKENRIWDQALLTHRANEEKALYEREQDRIQEERLQQEAEDLKDYRLKQNKLGFSRLDAEREKLDYQRSRLDYDKVEKAKRGQTQEIKDQLEEQWIERWGDRAGHGGEYPTSYQVYPDRDEMPTLDTVNKHLDGLKTHRDKTGQVVWVNEHIGPADEYGKVHPDGVFRYFTLEEDGRDGLELLSEHRISGITAHEAELTQKRTHDATTKKDSAKNDWDRKKYMMDALQTAVSEALQLVDKKDGRGLRKRGKKEQREYIDTYMGEVRRMADEIEDQQEGLLSRAYRFAQTAWQTAQQAAQQEAQQEDPQEDLPEDPQEDLPEDIPEDPQEDISEDILDDLVTNWPPSAETSTPLEEGDVERAREFLKTWQEDNEGQQEDPIAEMRAAWAKKKSRGGALDTEWVKQKAKAAHELGMYVKVNEKEKVAKAVVSSLPAYSVFELRGEVYIKQPDGKSLKVGTL